MRFSTVPKRQFRPPRLGPAGSTAAEMQSRAQARLMPDPAEESG